MRTGWLGATVALVMLLAPAGHSRAAVSDPAFVETAVASSLDLSLATGLAWAPDATNRLFVTRKDGEIRIIKDGVLLPTPFATVTPLYNISECGLIGIAFDPDFLVNQAVYVFATVAGLEQQVIRYTASGDIGTAKTTVVPGLPTGGNNHDGGAVGIGPDGKIYWAIGDNGYGIGVNEDLISLASKVGRANIDGSPVADNPFFDGAGPNADHIWARGFRNPFTFTFQPATGLLWVNDTGNLYEQVFIVRRGDHAGWNTYENNQPQGFITPVIAYRTNDRDIRPFLPAAMSGAVRAGGVITFATTTPHGFRVGGKVYVIEVVDPSFNGTFFVATTPSATTFTVVQAGPDAVSGGGSATGNYLGGAITGGTFYDATGFPPPYRGNFLFGDYNGGFINRATIDPATNNITSVDQWATSVVGAVDVAVGPDGALYYVGNGSNAVFRAAYTPTVQGLVVSPTNVWTAEGQPSMVMVHLAMAPAADVTVSAARSAGDAEIGVAAGATLTFTTANWSVPQPVTIAAGRDLDTTDDLATIAITATGIPSEAVTVHARDQNPLSLNVSSATLAVDEGQSGTFTVVLSQQPSLDVVVTVTRSAGDADITAAPGTLTFTRANWSVPQIVTVTVAEDADGSPDAATISVASPGLVVPTVAVSGRDNDAAAPLITSTPVTRAVVAVPYRYDVDATGLPPATFSLDSTVTGMTIDPSTGVIAWTPVAAGSFPVTVRASNGVMPDATQSFGIEVSLDGGADAGGTGQDGGASDASSDASSDGASDASSDRSSDGSSDGSSDRSSDAGTSDARLSDASTSDGGTPRPTDSGCGCRAAPGATQAPGATLMIVVLVLATASRRRRRR